MTDAERREVIERCFHVLRHSDATRREILAASRTLMLADELNRRRDRDEAVESQEDRRERASAIRAVLQAPGAVERLSEATRELFGLTQKSLQNKQGESDRREELG
jgi:hypothetical protein